MAEPYAYNDERRAKLERLRIEVARWANEQRGVRQSDLIAIYERRIFLALDSLGQWREVV